MHETSSPRTGAGRAIAVAIGLTVLAFFGTLVVGIVVVVPLFVMGYDLVDTPVLVVSIVATQFAFLAVGALYVKLYGVRIPFSIPTLRSLAVVAGGTVLALVVATVLMGVLITLDVMPDAALEETAAIDPTFLLVIAALSVLLIAPAEEYLFRGVIQGRLRESMGSVGAVVAASLLFGSMHLPNYIGSPVEMVAGAFVITCVGVVFGALYELTDNLAVPILVHAIYNVILMVSSYLAM